jgi:hypothetical protein
MNNTILLVVGIAILTLAVGTATSVSNALIPSAHAKSGAGAVPLIPIQTGNKALDKTIQSFYSCIKKTGHTGGSKPEPSKAEVINCYTNTFNTATTTTPVGGA